MSTPFEMKVSSKLSLGFGLLVTLMLAIGGVAYNGMHTVTNKLDDTLNDKLPKLELISAINYNVLDIARSLRNAYLEPEKIDSHINRVIEARSRTKESVDQLQTMVRLPEGKAIMKRIVDARSAYIDGQETLIRLLREMKAPEARLFLLTEMRKRQAVYAEATADLQALQKKVLDESGKSAQKEAASTTTKIVIALASALAVAILAAWLIIRDLVGKLGGEPAYAADNVRSIAAGDLSRTIATRPGDTTSLLVSLKSMQEGLAKLVGEIREMVSAAAKGDFSRRIDLNGKQGFGREIGESLNQLAETTDTGLADVVRVSKSLAAGDLSQRIEKDYPGVFGETGRSVNATVDALKRIVADIDEVARAAGQGDFSVRAELEGKQGFARELSEALNQLSQITDTGLTDVVRVAQALAAGDLSQRIEKNYPGVFGETGRAVNATVDALKRIVADIEEVARAAGRGDFSVRAGLEGKQGFARDLSEILNQLSQITESGLKDIMRVANTLAQGDLTQTIEKEYPGLFGETRNGINATVANLGSLVVQIQGAVDAINTAANEISAGNLDLSSRTEEQASSLEETAASMEQLNSTVKNNTMSANQARTRAVDVTEIARRGGHTVTKSAETMAGIAESSTRIADIISVIDGIAFQTNILALNAAVEAARAGEQGRGFAVVATEVRSLAKRSAEAAKEIKSLINDSVARVKDGKTQTELAGTQMLEIVSEIEKVSTLISEISSASNEQASGIEQISQAVSQMDEVTQQNAALVEQAAAAAESLKAQAAQLSDAVSVFKLDQTYSKQNNVAKISLVTKPLSASKAATSPHGHPAIPMRQPPSTKHSGERFDEEDSWNEF